MDRRDRNHRWWARFDERTMIVCMVYHDDIDDDDVDPAHNAHRIPVIYEVCGTCEGRGHHVNPNVDRNGLSADDFAEDPDFAESYLAGHYDVPCSGCNGKRVAIVVDEARATQEQQGWISDWFQEQHEDRMTRYYENGGQW